MLSALWGIDNHTASEVPRREMKRFDPKDPDFEQRVRASFARQAFMQYLGAEIVDISVGRVAIELPVRPELTQQHGFVHAGATAAIADVAGGYAAATLFPPDSGIVSVEFKINLLAPATGARLRATGRVVKSGKRLTVCDSEVVAIQEDGAQKLVARMQQTTIPTTDYAER